MNKAIVRNSFLLWWQRFHNKGYAPKAQSTILVKTAQQLISLTAYQLNSSIAHQHNLTSVKKVSIEVISKLRSLENYSYGKAILIG